MAEWLNVALPKGRLGEKVYKMFAKAGFECPEVLDDTRKLILKRADQGSVFLGKTFRRCNLR